MHRPGDTLGGRYRLDERIGAGGMGEVWRATDLVLNRVVAVKVVLGALAGDRDFVRRFLTEARAMASVRHPNVVAIHDFHGDEAGAYLVMEYVEGESLAHALLRLGRLGPAAAMDLVAQAAEALHAVHERGIVHRDVKPGNIIVRANGSVALTDFGIALSERQTSLTTAGAVLGTPSYLAPEQVLGQAATPRSDVYALGVVAYECLAGRRPFMGDNPFAIALQRVNEPPPPLPRDVPHSVADVVARALATDPGRRWPAAMELARAARQAIGVPVSPLAGEVTTTVLGAGPDTSAWTGPTLPSSPAPATARRGLRPLWIVALAVAVVGAGALGAAAFDVGGLTLGRSVDGGSHPAATTPGSGRSPGVSAPASPGGETAPSAAGVDSTARNAPDGFASCGDAYCPKAPACWNGTIVLGGYPQPLRSKTCPGPHSWETFVVDFGPADALKVPQGSLIERPAIAKLCSPEHLAQRSRDPAQTTGWDIDVWPVQADDGAMLLYCITHKPDVLETNGSVIKPA